MKVRRCISRAGQDSSSELVILMKVFDGMMAQMIQERDLVVFGRHVTGEVPGDPSLSGLLYYLKTVFDGINDPRK